MAAILAGLVWFLSRPARSLAGRIAVTAVVLLVGTGYWSPRPLLIGLILLALLIASTETQWGSPWLMVPIMWLWLNVHGSWPLGVGYLVVRLVGRRLDHRPLGQLPRRIATAVAGCALGLLNPFGWRLVAYPLVVITKHPAFAHIVEWQSPSFSDPVNVVFLVGALGAFVLLVARSGSTEDALVVAVFTSAALLASRNVPVAALVLTPVLARGLTGLGTVTGTRRGVVPAVALAAVVVVGALLVTGAVRNPAWNLTEYPVAEVSWMQSHHLIPGRVATPDFVGNYLELRYGARCQRVHRRPGGYVPAVGGPGQRHPPRRWTGVAGGADQVPGPSGAVAPGPAPRRAGVREPPLAGRPPGPEVGGGHCDRRPGARLNPSGDPVMGASRHPSWVS